MGFGTHYWDAYLSMPEKLIDGYKWRDHALNDTLNSNYVWWADYDEMGFWEFYSLKNFCIHAVPTSFITFLFALAYFPDREPLMGKLCGSIAKVGLHPMFCV